MELEAIIVEPPAGAAAGAEAAAGAAGAAAVSAGFSALLLQAANSETAAAKATSERLLRMVLIPSLNVTGERPAADESTSRAGARGAIERPSPPSLVLRSGRASAGPSPGAR